MLRRSFALAFAALAFGGALHTRSSAPQEPPGCKPSADWNQPAPPRRIYANVRYVGSHGLSSLPPAGDGRHVLLDGATQRTAPPIDAGACRRHGKCSIAFFEKRLAKERARISFTEHGS